MCRSFIRPQDTTRQHHTTPTDHKKHKTNTTNHKPQDHTQTPQDNTRPRTYHNILYLWKEYNTTYCVEIKCAPQEKILFSRQTQEIVFARKYETTQYIETYTTIFGTKRP